MQAFDPNRVKALFQAATDLSALSDRAAFLDRECGDDPALRQRLEELLAAFDSPAEVLETGPGARPVAAEQQPEVAHGDRTRTFQSQDPPAGPGALIAGRYRIRQEIGEGGMGSVYLAEQTQPVKRLVAVKLIRAGMDSRSVLARFESERQALALMDHPNIAKVLDAGSTEAGQPFFVMELVKGIPVNEYCDRHSLGLPERLALFRQICSAVQHAHQKGIIHRDLKPSNILIESHDDKPVPKVIDFGLAKATSGLRLTENSIQSLFGTVAGTPLYMAPEQAVFNAIDIDTRADIYALGVILYELLTGTTPIPREVLKQAALDEMLRMVREVEPPTPSSRISSSKTAPSIASTRQAEPVRLGRFIRGDLDWVVMKALAKERQRRYESAIALAQDIERFMNHEPVSAGPPTALYRFRKFVRRNRARVVAAVLVLLTLVGGVIGTTLGLFEATRQREIAEGRRREAEKRLAQKDKANAILLSVFRDLNPRGGGEEHLPLADRLGRRLDVATAELEGESTDDPVGVARLQVVLAESQLGLGYADKAIALATKARKTLEQALGLDHPDTLTSVNELAAGYDLSHKLDLAIPLFEDTLARRTKQLGREHPDTLVSMNNLAECYRSATQLDRAIPLLTEALAAMKKKMGPDHVSTLMCMRNLAAAYLDDGKPELAIPLTEDALRLAKSKYGADDPETLASMLMLSRAYAAAGKFDLDIPLLEDAVKIGRTKLGPDHPDTLTALNNLAECYRSTGQVDRALPLLEESLKLTRGRYGPSHRESLVAMNNLAIGYKMAGKLDLAAQLEEETLTLRKANLGLDHPETLASMQNLAVTYRMMGQLDRAGPLIDEAVRLKTAKLGPDHPETWLARGIQGLNYLDTGRVVEAIPLLEGAHRMREKQAALRVIAPYLLDAYLRAKRPEKAAALAREMIAEGRAGAAAGSVQLAAILGNAALGLVAAAAWDEAEPVIRECLAIREKDEPDVWTTFQARSLLGAVMLGRGKYAEAEPLLRGGFEGLKARADKIPRQAKPRLGEALDRLIALADATGKADEAKAWREERAKLVKPAEPTSEKR